MTKGYVKPVNEAVGKFVSEVKEHDARLKYEGRVRDGFSKGWAIWYNYMMSQLIENADEWADKEGIDKWKAVKNIVKEASAKYRKAKLGLFYQEAKTELEEAKSLVKEALGLIGV